MNRQAIIERAQIFHARTATRPVVKFVVPPDYNYITFRDSSMLGEMIIHGGAIENGFTLCGLRISDRNVYEGMPGRVAGLTCKLCLGRIIKTPEPH